MPFLSDRIEMLSGGSQMKAFAFVILMLLCSCDAPPAEIARNIDTSDFRKEFGIDICNKSHIYFSGNQELEINHYGEKFRINFESQKCYENFFKNIEENSKIFTNIEGINYRSQGELENTGDLFIINGNKRDTVYFFVKK